jgi:hypothetical protein
MEVKSWLSRDDSVREPGQCQNINMAGTKKELAKEAEREM